MGIESRERLFGPTISAAAERAAKARKEADRLACEAWNYRMLGSGGPPSPHLSSRSAAAPDQALTHHQRAEPARHVGIHYGDAVRSIGPCLSILRG